MTRASLAGWLVAVVAIAGGFGYAQWAAGERERIEDERDRVAGDLAVQRLRADSLQAAMAQEVGSLSDALEERGEDLRRVSEELTAARGTIETLTDFVASATGDATSQGDEEPAQQASSHATPPEPRAWTGEVNDGPLAAAWRFWLPRADLRLRWRVNIPGTLVTARMGDGRVLVYAESSDPRVSLDLGQALFERPEPEVRYRTDWKLTGVLVSLAAALGAVFGGG